MNNNEIIFQANRCLNCKNPKCVEACPLHVDVPQILSYLKQGNVQKAFELDMQKNPLGIICGIVCPHEKQCQGACVRGIKEQPVQIGMIENFVCKSCLENTKIDKTNTINTNSKVAIIGGGPAGITCAYELSKAGIKSTIFEKEEYLGGILQYGIPDFRLDKQLVDQAIKSLMNENIEIKYNQSFTNDTSGLSINNIKDMGYDYILLAIGRSEGKMLDIQGASSSNVLEANSYLKEYYEGKLISNDNRKIAVIGGGNVAIDTARVAKKLGNSVTIIYRKTLEKMPANKEEIDEAIKEGVKFIFESNVIKITQKEKLELQLDTQKEIIVDKLIFAVGSLINQKIFEEDFYDKESGLIKVNSCYETTTENVFAGGDLVTNKGTVTGAIVTAMKVANEIILREKHKKTT